jgi:glycosyltransferase involved in cell wall biosynthesis
MKLSIITINRNNVTGLEKTIQSVVTQTTTDFEYIVIDGASDDGSVDVIRKHADKITYWVSEPDSGIYNAMNKGIRKAQGDYCLFLNSGDWLIESETLANVFVEIAGLPEAGVYYSDRMGTDGYLSVTAEQYTIDNLLSGGPSHQNSLIKTKLFFEHEFYDERYKIIADSKFFVKEFCIYKSVSIHLKNMIALVDVDGISHTERSLLKNEWKILYHDVFGDFDKILLELVDYRSSVYGDIIRNWGNSKPLDFMLKTYRYIIRRIKKR